MNRLDRAEIRCAKNTSEFNMATESLGALLKGQSATDFHEVHVHELKGEAATRDALRSTLGE